MSDQSFMPKAGQFPFTGGGYILLRGYTAESWDGDIDRYAAYIEAAHQALCTTLNRYYFAFDEYSSQYSVNGVDGKMAFFGLVEKFVIVRFEDERQYRSLLGIVGEFIRDKCVVLHDNNPWVRLPRGIRQNKDAHGDHDAIIWFLKFCRDGDGKYGYGIDRDETGHRLSEGYVGEVRAWDGSLCIGVVPFGEREYIGDVDGGFFFIFDDDIYECKVTNLTERMDILNNIAFCHRSF